MILERKVSLARFIYIINDEILESLDRLEDVPVEYRREQIETIFGLVWYICISLI